MENAQIVELLLGRIDGMELHAKKNNLLISGLDEEKGEDTLKTVQEVLYKLMDKKIVIEDAF